MTFLHKILAGSSIPAGDVLSEALDAWVYRDSPKKLETLYGEQPNLFKDLDKGLKYKTLYRVVRVSQKQLEELLEKGTLPAPSGSFESWSAASKGLQHFMNKMLDNDAYFALVLKRAIPAAERIVCISCLKNSPAIRDDDSRVAEEKEVICKKRPVELKWVWKILEHEDDLINPGYTMEQLKNKGVKVPERLAA